MSIDDTDKPVYLPSLDAVAEERRYLRRQKRYRRTLIGTINILIVVAAIAVLISTQLLSILQVSGTSMEPQLMDGDLLLLIKVKHPQRGDLCGFYYQNKLLLKRVIGLSGDYINLTEDGTLLVNGQVLDEPYLIEKGLGITNIDYPYQVPDGHYFFMGDNRMTSIDSRHTQLGTIQSEQIVGKVVCTLWRFKKGLADAGKTQAGD